MSLGNLSPDYNYKTDEELVVLAQKGDERAIEQILKRYNHVLEFLSETLYIAGADEEDVKQEGRLGLHKAVMSFSPQVGTKFSTFANLCIRSQVYSAIKAANRQKKQPLNQAKSIDEPLYAQMSTERTLQDVLTGNKNNNPEYMWLKKETIESIWNTAATVLSKMELQVLEMHIQGCDYKEIANQIGRSEKAVDNALQRAKLKLKKFQQE